MTLPFGYVSPEQQMKDRADYARKGIARGRSVVVVQYASGILFVAENPSRSLHKINELYDRIAFAAVGRYNEFENLRMAGVRLADLRGYAYDRRDVTGRGLANTYAQTLGSIFIESPKPYEVEIIVAEVGDTPAADEIYRLTYDGSVADEHGSASMGGQAEAISRYVEGHYQDGLSLADALRVAVDGLAHDSGETPREIPSSQLEVAVLDRDRPRRKFRRLTQAALEQLRDGGSGAATTPPPDAAPEPPSATPPDGAAPGAPPATPPAAPQS